MRVSFYEYIKRFANKDGKDPQSRLANAITRDMNFPKHSKSFNEISDYLESEISYANLLMTFDDIWEIYEAK